MSKRKPMNGGFASVAEYAALRGISRKSIYKLCEDPGSGFPHLRFGNRIIIPVLEADTWARRQVKTPDYSQSENLS
jgi:hypothetical protein